MKTKDFTYSKRNVNALAHMIGQLVDIGQTATLSDVSKWFRISKYKSNKLVNMLIGEGLVYEVYVDYRKNAKRKEYGLTSKGYHSYYVSDFYTSYKYFAAEVLYRKEQVVLS